MKAFNRPDEFPNESFVQKSIEKFFASQGFEIDAKGQIDLKAWNGKSENWIIEVKGASESVRTDFNTCIGQLIGHMDNDKTKYAIALPKVDKYLHQCKKLPAFICKKLGLYIILVDDNGLVNIINPDDRLEV